MWRNDYTAVVVEQPKRTEPTLAVYNFENLTRPSDSLATDRHLPAAVLAAATVQDEKRIDWSRELRMPKGCVL
jgi:hypothetical protein